MATIRRLWRNFPDFKQRKDRPERSGSAYRSILPEAKWPTCWPEISAPQDLRDFQYHATKGWRSYRKSDSRATLRAAGPAGGE